MKKMPKEILVYQCDTCDGQPIYAVARNIEEIPEDIQGETVGVYTFKQQNTFKVVRGLV
jgi:hypothetical protein